MKVLSGNPLPYFAAHSVKAGSSAPPHADRPDTFHKNVLPTPRFGSDTVALTPLSRLPADERAAVFELGERYKDFLGRSVCAPLTAKTIIEEAEKRGFRPLPNNPNFRARAGDKFYINNDYESVALVVMGRNNPVTSGFNIVGAHMDSPQLELKPNTLTEAHGVARLKTKTRGGGIWGHWFNRPLGVAGRIYESTPDADGKPGLNGLTRLPEQNTRFFRLDTPSLAIASEPIHFNRTLNKGREIQPEEDMTPIAGIENGADGSGVGEHVQAILKEKGLDLSKAGRAELFLYPATPPQDSGADGSLIIGAGQDDKLMCFAAMDALFEAAEQGPPTKTSIAAFFDNEEVGSLDRGGARSRWLETVAADLIRLKVPRPGDLTMARERALSKSVIISADVSHGFLPQQAKYHDRQNAARIGYGPAIKADSDGHYATTAKGIAIAEDIAARAGVPIQTMSTNQDVSCGTTIGPMIGANTNALTIDIGTPVLSMHSPGEISSKADVYFTRKLFAAFYANL